MPNKMTQCEWIIWFINKYGSITPKDAMRYGIMRLASRINDLKRAGYNIKTTMETNTDEYGIKSRYARYSLGV